MKELIRLTAFKTMLDLFLAQAIEEGKQYSGEWASDQEFDLSEKNAHLNAGSTTGDSQQSTNKLLLQKYLDTALRSNPSLYNDLKQMLKDYFPDTPSN